MRILVSKINFLGDAVSFLPTLKGLAEHIPGVKLTIVCTPVGRQVFDGVIENLDFYIVEYLRARSPLFIRELMSALKKFGTKRFDISLHSYDEPTFSHVLAASLRIPERVGFDSRIAKGQMVLSMKLPFDISRNVVDLNFDLVRFVTANPNLKPRRVPIRYSQTDHHYVLSRLAEVGMKKNAGFIVLHPGAKLPYKEWGAQEFSYLAERLEKKLGFRTLLITERANASSSVHREINGLSVKQMACLLEKALLFVGNNSGPMHVATAMGTPSVIIQGPSPSNWDIFWQDIRHRIVRADNLPCLPCERLGAIPGACLNRETPLACMKNISVELVEEQVTELLKLLDL